MSLPSLQLDAFLAVSRLSSFSKAAESLHVTQSALSQRVLGLEDELGVALFNRRGSGVTLTEAGSKLLRYCQTRETLERDFLNDVKGERGMGLAGVIRIAGYSSVMRSVILPALSDLLRKHPRVQLEASSLEIQELKFVLARAQADLVVFNQPMEAVGVEQFTLGHEKIVLVESSKTLHRADVYLDHDADDATTALFLNAQKKSPSAIRRSFLDDVYGILDGVALGFGKAVVSRHLLRDYPNLRIVPGCKAVKSPVVLCHPHQSFYTPLQQAAVNAIRQNAPSFLEP